MQRIREDTSPWYRQFWPWFIIALPASAVVAGLYTVWLAVQTNDSLVVQSEVGMDVVTEQHEAAENEALRLGLSAEIGIDIESGAVEVTLFFAGGTPDPRSLSLEFIHPTLAVRDVTITLSRAMSATDGAARWAGHFLTVPDGRHYVVLSSDDGWRLSGEWFGQELTRLGTIDQADNGGR